MTRCPECGHLLSTGDHADQCMTARDPAALRALVEYDGPKYVGDELDEPELVDEEYDEGEGR